MRSPRLAAAVVAAPLLLGGCKIFDDSTDPDTVSMPKSVGMVVLESDFTTSGGFGVDPDTHATSEPIGISWDADPQLRRLVDPSGKEHLFVLGRHLGRLMEIDRTAKPLRDGDARYWSVVDDGADPASANPYDAAYAPDGSLWVTRYFQSSLAILDADGKRTGTVDLKAWADADGRPEMTAITILDGIAYVALARLAATADDPTPGPTAMGSIVVAIDTKTHAVSQAFPSGALPVPTPAARFRHAVFGPPKQLFLSCLGAPMSKLQVAGGIVKLDFEAKTQTLVLDGRALAPASGATFRGFVSGYDVLDDERGFAIVASMETADNPTSVVEFNPSTGTIVSAVWYGRSSFQLFDLAIADDRLLIADRYPYDPAIVVLDASDGATIGRVKTQLPPVELVLIRPQN